MCVANEIEISERVLLVVDGSSSDLSLINQLSKSKRQFPSFNIVEVNSCKEAAKKMRVLNPCCCLISDQQPREDRLDFLKSLQRSKPYNSAPVIILASEEEGDARSAVEMIHRGAQDYLIRDELTENNLRRSINDAIHYCESQKNLHYLAHHDDLTGLLNRSLFFDRLENTVNHCKRYDHGCSLLYIDIDNFKQINDQYGHEAGDTVLKTIAERIKKNCRATDSAARLGGDEFAILIGRIDKDKASQTAEKILKKASEPVYVDLQKLHISLSIGVAHYPDTANNFNDLMEQADQAMYRAKKAGKSRYFQFSQNQKLQWERRGRLETMLPKAIENDELKLYFQPIVSAVDKTLYSLNVIVVWSPGRYKVSTEELNGMLDNLNLVESYYRWFVNASLKKLSQWQENNPETKVCLNLPVNHCHPDVLVDLFREGAKDHGIQPSLLEIEISEKALMKDVMQGRKYIKAMKNVGFRVSINAFDGGYSSIDDLTMLPLDTLKIDQSWLSDADVDSQKYKTAEALTLLSHTLGLKIIAKDVDRKDQCEKAKNINCDLMQGDYFVEAKPSIEDCEKYIDEYLLPKEMAH